jgi:hypothetical protein
VWDKENSPLNYQELKYENNFLTLARAIRRGKKKEGVVTGSTFNTRREKLKIYCCGSS